MSAPRFQPTTEAEVVINLNLYFTADLRINRDGEIMASAEAEAKRAMLAHVREIEKLANKLGLTIEDNDDGVEVNPL